MKPQALWQGIATQHNTVLVCCIFAFLFLAWTQGAGRTHAGRAVHLSQQQQQQQQHKPSQWDFHYIFDGPGKLDLCPSSSSSSHQGWLQGSWANSEAWAEQSAKSGLVLPHSARAQQMIWQQQHPADCSTAKYLVYHDYGVGARGHGIGSVLHQQANALMVAMDTNRVLVIPPGSFLAADPSYCSSNSRSLDTCYFEPLTHCRLTEEQRSTAFAVGNLTKEQQRAFYAGNDTDLPQVVSLAGQILFHHVSSSRAPRPFQALLDDSSDIPAASANYWWKAQATAYFVRPNHNTLKELERRKREKLRGKPLQPGCVSVYIRHGDKGTESQVFEDGAYEEALQQLRSVDASLTRQVFLSTEDPASVQYFTNKTRGWRLTYVDMPRKPDRNVSNVEYMLKHGVANEMLDGLLNLDLALQCDGFVSSLNGNWARLIEELRSTVRCKAGAVLMDVGERSARGLKLRYP